MAGTRSLCTVLVAITDGALRAAVLQLISSHGFSTAEATSIDEAMQVIETVQPLLLVLDGQDRTAAELANRLAGIDEQAPVIVLASPEQPVLTGANVMARFSVPLDEAAFAQAIAVWCNQLMLS
jgi:CheY-like chemotaxis protein